MIPQAIACRIEDEGEDGDSHQAGNEQRLILQRAVGLEVVLKIRVGGLGIAQGEMSPHPQAEDLRRALKRTEMPKGQYDALGQIEPKVALGTRPPFAPFLKKRRVMIQGAKRIARGIVGRFREEPTS